jgi:hypothetical protein
VRRVGSRVSRCRQMLIASEAQKKKSRRGRLRTFQHVSCFSFLPFSLSLSLAPPSPDAVRRFLSASTHPVGASSVLILETVPKKREGSQADMMTQSVTAGKPREEVSRAARAVHEFLLNENSDLRKYLSAMSDGAVYFVSNVHCKTACAAVRFRKEDDGATPGIGVEDFVIAAQGRLCD